MALLLAMFFGGWATSRLAVGESKVEAILYGIILWGALFLGLVWLFSVGVRTGFGVMVEALLGGLLPGGRGRARPLLPASSRACAGAITTNWGGDKFVADLQKAGISEEQAKKAQAELKDTLGRLGDESTSIPEVARDVANRPEVQKAANQATSRRGRPPGGRCSGSSPPWRWWSPDPWSARVSSSNPSPSWASAATRSPVKPGDPPSAARERTSGETQRWTFAFCIENHVHL